MSDRSSPLTSSTIQIRSAPLAGALAAISALRWSRPQCSCSRCASAPRADQFARVAEARKGGSEPWYRLPEDELIKRIDLTIGAALKAAATLGAR
jgi:hypothetical protein